MAKRKTKMRRKTGKGSRTPVTRVKPIDAEWYQNPSCVGDERAKDLHRWTWQNLKPYAKTAKARELCNVAIKWDEAGSRYWWFLTKQHVQHVKHCLRGFKRGESYMQMLLWVNRRSGMLVDDLTRYLEVKAYDENPAAFLEEFTDYYTWLGMPQDEADERVTERVEGFRERLGLD